MNQIETAHGVSQPTWQGNLVALRNSDKLPCFRRSQSATDECCEARYLYGKAKPKAWDFDATLSPSNPAPVSKAERKDKRESSRWVTDWIPCDRSQGFRAAKPRNPRRKAAIAVDSSTVKRFPLEIVNKVTGDKEQILAKLKVNTVMVKTYGVTFTFTRTVIGKGNPNARIRDSRDAGLKAPVYVRAELRRILGASVGDAEFAKLFA